MRKLRWDADLAYPSIKTSKESKVVPSSELRGRGRLHGPYPRPRRR